MITMPTVRTEYHGYRRVYVDTYGDRNTTSNIMKRTNLEMAWPLKIAAMALVLPILLFFAWALPFWLTIPINTVLIYFATKIFIIGRLKVEKINSNSIAKTLRDEAGECISMLSDLNTAATLTPEGSGIRNRTDQYGAMLWKIMGTLQLLNEANELVSGKGTTFYANMTTLKTQLKDLERAGESLVELTASKRMDSVMQDMEFMGITEFKDQVNLEMMAHRSLGTGADEEYEKPFGGMKGVFE